MFFFLCSYLFFFLPWIKDSFSEDFDFDLSGQLSRSTQEHFNLTSTVTLPLRSTWFGPRRLLFAFRWRRPDSNFCCLMIPLPLWQLRWDLNSQDIWRRYLNPQFGPKVQSMTRAQSFLSSGGCAKICPKRMRAKISMVKKWNDGLHLILWQAQSYYKPMSYKLMICLFSLWRVLMVTPIVKGSSYCGP